MHLHSHNPTACVRSVHSEVLSTCHDHSTKPTLEKELLYFHVFQFLRARENIPPQADNKAKDTSTKT